MRHDRLMEISIARALQPTYEITGRSKVTQGGSPLPYEEGVIFFLSGRLGNVTWLPDIHPSFWNDVGHRLETAVCWFVIQTDRLNSSVQVCLAGSLHDYVTLLQVHNSYLHDGVSYLASNIFSLFFPFFFFFCKKRNNKINHDKNTQTGNVHCHAYQFAVLFSFFVSQVNTVKIYTVNDFQ